MLMSSTDDDKMVRLGDIRSYMERSFENVGLSKVDLKQIAETDPYEVLWLSQKESAALAIMNFFDKIERMANGERLI